MTHPSASGHEHTVDIHGHVDVTHNGHHTDVNIQGGATVHPSPNVDIHANVHTDLHGGGGGEIGGTIHF